MLAADAYQPILLWDDFESYAPGVFPSSNGWFLRFEGAGAAEQYVSQERSVSGSQSFRLMAAGFGSHVAVPISFPQQFSVEVMAQAASPLTLGSTIACPAVFRVTDPRGGPVGYRRKRFRGRNPRYRRDYVCVG